MHLPPDLERWRHEIEDYDQLNEIAAFPDGHVLSVPVKAAAKFEAGVAGLP